MSVPQPFPGPDREALTTRIEQDREIDLVIGRLLQIGVFAAAAVVAVGAIAFLIQHGRTLANYRVFTPGPSTQRTVTGILRGVRALDSRSIVQLGLVMLILTPIARVALTLVAFIIQRDRLYVLITTIVLALLLYSLIVGV